MNPEQNYSDVEGYCYCRAIRFKVTAPLGRTSHCHCQSCRLSHGSAFVTWTSFSTSQLTLQGGEHLQTYESSPGTQWLFCRHCGSQMFQKNSAQPQTLYVSYALLHSLPASTFPQCHLSYEERPLWMANIAQLPCFLEKGEQSLPSDLA